MKTQPKGSPLLKEGALELKAYQAEAIYELSLEENPRMMLADEPGMGKSVQAIGVAERTGAKRILWVTTNGNKQTVREEILKHTHNDPGSIEILSGNFQTRSKQLKNLGDKKIHDYQL